MKTIFLPLLLLLFVVTADCEDLTVKLIQKEKSTYLQKVIHKKEIIFTLLNSQGLLSFSLCSPSLKCEVSKFQDINNLLIKIFDKKTDKFLTCFMIKNGKIEELPLSDISYIRNFINTRIENSKNVDKLMNNGEFDKLYKLFSEIRNKNDVYRKKIRLLLKSCPSSCPNKITGLKDKK